MSFMPRTGGDSHSNLNAETYDSSDVDCDFHSDFNGDFNPDPDIDPDCDPDCDPDPDSYAVANADSDADSQSDADGYANAAAGRVVRSGWIVVGPRARQERDFIRAQRVVGTECDRYSGGANRGYRNQGNDSDPRCH